MQIHVRTLTGQRITVNLESTSTWAEVKRRICDQTRLPTEQQKLLVAGKEYPDTETLQQHQISEYTQIHLVLRLREAINTSNTSAFTPSDMPDSSEFTATTTSSTRPAATTASSFGWQPEVPTTASSSSAWLDATATSSYNSAWLGEAATTAPFSSEEQPEATDPPPFSSGWQPEVTDTSLFSSEGQTVPFTSTLSAIDTRMAESMSNRATKEMVDIKRLLKDIVDKYKANILGSTGDTDGSQSFYSQSSASSSAIFKPNGQSGVKRAEDFLDRINYQNTPQKMLNVILHLIDKEGGNWGENSLKTKIIQGLIRQPIGTITTPFFSKSEPEITKEEGRNFIMAVKLLLNNNAPENSTNFDEPSQPQEQEQGWFSSLWNRNK